MAKRITRKEQDRGNAYLKPDTPLPKSKTRCTKKRPTYADVVRIKTLTSYGINLDIVASECDCSRDTIERWCREYSDIATALKQGRNNRTKRAFACFYKQAFPVDSDGNPTCKGSPELMKWWMATIEGHSDRYEVEKQIRALEEHARENGNEPPTIIYNLKKKVRNHEGVEDDES